MQQPPPANVAMLCLQAQQVAGLPDAAEGRHIQLTTTTPAPTTAAAVCRAGVADFHRQVLLLHCAPVSCIDDVQVTVTMLQAATACNDDHHPAAAGAARVIVATVSVDLAQQLCRPSPSVLTFVLGSRTTAATATAAAGAGAVLSLALHHRLLVTTTTTTRTGTGCSSLLRSCLRLPLAAGCCPPLPVLRTTNRQHQVQGRPAEAADDGNQGDGDSSSSGFITIEKGTISRRRPPSDYLLTTDDDDEADGNKRPPGPPTMATTCCWSLSSLDDDAKVENDFLAMLMLEEEEDDDDDLVQLDALIKDAEADLSSLPYAWQSRGRA